MMHIPWAPLGWLAFASGMLLGRLVGPLYGLPLLILAVVLHTAGLWVLAVRRERERCARVCEALALESMTNEYGADELRLAARLIRLGEADDDA